MRGNVNLKRRVGSLEWRWPGRSSLAAFHQKAAYIDQLTGPARDAALRALFEESRDAELEMLIAECEAAEGRPCSLPLSDANLKRVMAGMGIDIEGVQLW
jgi:hypothetical protein